VNAHSEREALEAFLREADRRVQRFLKDAGRERKQLEKIVRLRADAAIRKGAGGLRQRLTDLHDSLETLSTRLEKVEGRRSTGRKAPAPKPAAPSRKPAARQPAAPSKVTRRRSIRRKKAA
jgi:hypothetical protein